MTKPMTIARREDELAAYLDKQPYLTELDSIQLNIAKNVFPSDFGLTSSFVGNFMLQQAPAQRALDMACGSGYFAFVLRKIGCAHVVGVDFNVDAVQCARENANRNPKLQPVTFLHSDLFADVPPLPFDLIMFNFNYYPSDGTFGLNADGGREIVERFFRQVGNYSHAQTRIYMPYSQFVGETHDPKRIAPEFGFSVRIAATLQNQTGEHYIYQITKTH
jgi:SAM-dependent methyltransferase